ncbi:hypothetical protein ACETK8_15895 [Brevundimonas staleyi]|uniref:DUF6948 domain-containing protein n=1 Tax=Brevundimonas staleyi TaxID=74326 RepID=A0ABW0FXV4_9CAUL
MNDTTLTPEAAPEAPAADAVIPVSSGMGRHLAVADRGHVWAAEDVMFDDDFARLKNARAVRRWGTSEGLNELAQKGPRPNTRLDAAADVLVSRRALIALIPCEAETWTA